LRAAREVALAQFDRGQSNKGSLDISRDFYPFCIRLTDSKLIARPISPATAGNDVRNRKIGKELYKAAMKRPEGAISGDYLYPKSAATAPPLPKTSIAVRVAPDLGCLVALLQVNRSTPQASRAGDAVVKN
jgi:hypothetical protein